MRVIVIGSPEWVDRETLWEKLSEIRGRLDPAGTLTVTYAVDGSAAMGQTALWCRLKRRLPRRDRAAVVDDAHKLDPDAGEFACNEQMIGLGADLVVAFLVDRPSGSVWHCMALAMDVGIPLDRVWSS